MKRILLYTQFFMWISLGLNYAYGQDLTQIKTAKPFAIQGSVELRGIFYHASGIPSRSEKFNYYFMGSPTLKLYGWDIPFSIMLSKEQRSFQQPFNQVGFSPTYKWITLHAGYRNITFSPYTLNGHTILGGGFELKPGHWRAGFMYGRLNRATVIDSSSMSLMPYSFSRKGMAAKLGYGTNDNFIDLHFLHAKDDSTSKPSMNGIPNSKFITPQANSVLGYGTRLSFWKKLYFESDGAISILTRDLNSPISLDSISDKTLRKLSNLLHINGTSEWFMAFQAGLGYQTKGYGIKVNYKRVEPGFTSMGSYYFTNDIENLTINPSYNHSSGKYRISSSFGLEQDNVRLQKQSTSRRFIASVNAGVDWNEQLGVDLIFNNFSNNQKPNTLKFADSLKIVQTNRTIGIMPRYLIQSAEKTQLFLISANFNSMNDYNSYFDNSGSAPSRDIKTNQFLLTYNLTFNKTGLNFNSSINYTGLKSQDIKNSYTGFNVGANYSFLNQKLFSGVNVGYIIGKSNDNTSKIFNGNLNLSYAIDKRQSVRAMVYFTNNNPGSVITGGNPAFSETRAELAYQLNFGL